MNILRNQLTRHIAPALLAAAAFSFSGPLAAACSTGQCAYGNGCYSPGSKHHGQTCYCHSYGSSGCKNAGWKMKGSPTLAAPSSSSPTTSDTLKAPARTSK